MPPRLEQPPLLPQRLNQPLPQRLDRPLPQSLDQTLPQSLDRQNPQPSFILLLCLLILPLYSIPSQL